MAPALDATWASFTFDGAVGSTLNPTTKLCCLGFKADHVLKGTAAVLRHPKPYIKLHMKPARDLFRYWRFQQMLRNHCVGLLLGGEVVGSCGLRGRGLGFKGDN